MSHRVARLQFLLLVGVAAGACQNNSSSTPRPAAVPTASAKQPPPTQVAAAPKASPPTEAPKVAAAHDALPPKAAAGHGATPRAPAHEILGDLLRGNDEFVRRTPPSHFASFRDSQHPRATVVGCSDSRFQTPSLRPNAEGDLFVIRNIGNQFGLAAGSITYGVRHLNTSLLVFVGHMACGAVKAAMGDYGDLERAVRQEIDGLHLSLAHGTCLSRPDPWTDCVRANVHEQVRVAGLEFADLVSAGKLTIVGLVYDFRNELGQGHGRSVVINVNGENDLGKLNTNRVLLEAAKRAGLPVPPLRSGPTPAPTAPAPAPAPRPAPPSAH